MTLRKNTAQFVFELAKVNPTVEIVGEYNGSREKTDCRCVKCGHLWRATPTNLLKGRKCPRCAKSGASFMDQFVYLAFVDVLGESRVVFRDRKTIGSELDVFVPPNFAVELGSWSWHKDKVNNADAEKRKLCEEKGIKLITVYDSVPESAVVPEGCIAYPFDLASEVERITLIKLTKTLLRSHLGEQIFRQPDWRSVEREAILRSGVRSHDRFVAELKIISPTILVESEYINDRTKVTCRCDVCGRIWKATPSSLLQKHGCKSCSSKRTADKQRKTHKVFLDELKRSNPGVELIGKYEGDAVKIACRCRKCENEWVATPSALRKGHGCPKCGLESSIRTRRKTHERFLAELSEVNPSIEAIGKYVNATTKIECSCRICDHRWMVVPDSLLSGTGCPKCGQRRSHDAHRKTHERFLAELLEINSSVDVLSKYIAAKTKVECLCKICGHHWMTTPDRLLHGMGCPECGKKKRANSRRKTHEQFVAEMARVNPRIIFKGKYEASKRKIECQCLICGQEWHATPGSLLRGAGCPHCKTISFLE